MNKKWYQSKTIWIGIATIAGGVAEYLASVPANASVGTVITGVVIVILRIVTATGIER